ncbi:MAG: hypothetical protein JWM20_851 [Patescibacteria group bacterium]|nr:hypothetical protein [Patescibacteria group bacterium]
MEKTVSRRCSLRYCNSSVVSSLQVIHYGASRFEFSKFNPIANHFGTYGIKPRSGGLWTSPVNSNHSWRGFCEGEDFNLHTLSSSFRLSFHGCAKIAIIDSYGDLENLPMRSFPKSMAETDVDWELVARNADAVWLTAKGETRTRLSAPYLLNGWDCETVLIMNPNCFYLV